MSENRLIEFPRVVSRMIKWWRKPYYSNEISVVRSGFNVDHYLMVLEAKGLL